MNIGSMAAAAGIEAMQLDQGRQVAQCRDLTIDHHPSPGRLRRMRGVALGATVVGLICALSWPSWPGWLRMISLGIVVLVLAILAGGYYLMDMPGQSYGGPAKPIAEEEVGVCEGLRRHVQELAGRIGERHVVRYTALEAAARYIEDHFTQLGYEVQSQPYEVSGRSVRNIEAHRLGSAKPRETVIVGAHYDSVMGSPGANDNASGVAALLEIARLLRDEPLPRTLRLVAFVNEESPYFQTGQMGSQVYARQFGQRGETVAGMLSLETLGSYSDRKGSQQYPAGLGRFYPDTGNFIGFVANTASRELLHRCLGSFRRHTPFPSEGIAAPEAIPGVGWSDHWSFWQEGYPAVMVTDTAFYRYPYYHTAQDTPDKLDYERTARVVSGVARVVAELAGTESP